MNEKSRKKRARGKTKPWQIWKYLRDYKFNSILIRNFVIIVLLVVLPSCLLGMFYNINTKQILQEEISETNLNSLHRSADVVETVMREMRDFAYNLAVSQDTRMFTFLDKNEVLSSGLAAKLNEDIKFYTLMYDYVDSIYIYSEQTNQVIYNGAIVDLSEVTDRTWLLTYRQMDSSTYVTQSRRKNDHYPYFITLICPLNSGYKKNMGAVVVNIDVEKLGKLVGSNQNLTQTLFIVDSYDRLLYSSDRSVLDNQDFLPDYLEFLERKDESYSKTQVINNQEMIVSSIRSERQSWQYILLSPLAVYKAKVNKISEFMVQVTLISLVLSLIVSYLLTLRSFQPVRNILNAMENPTAIGKKYLSDERHSNEVKYITNLVRSTQEQNSKLQLELEERLEKLNNAQLLALQSQIDPHFLYNTLDTINWMAVEKMGGENEVSAMITALAQLLRSGLQRANYLVTVEEELKHANQFIKILELRYKDKLRVCWHISDEIMPCKIVKLSIQPLLENAINHGLRSKRYQGTIHINGEMIGESVVISVEDDGVGMQEQDLRDLNAQLKEEYGFDDKHVGIRNVNQRIKLLFGEKYGVVIGARSRSGGLAVTLVFPKKLD